MKILYSLIAFAICTVPSFSEDGMPKTLLQSSFSHGKIGSDTIKLLATKNNDEGYYSNIQIVRNSKIAYSLLDSSLELTPFDRSVFKEISIGKGVFLYAFRVNDRPLPDKFLVLQVTSDTIVSLGITPNSTAIVFGDIDKDGIIEIGGYPDYNSNKFISFELIPGFPNDSLLDKAIETLLYKRQNNQKKK